MPIDWDACDHKLHKASVAAIKAFSRENPDTEVCCFFFDCDEVQYGHIAISLDTPENNLETAKELEKFAIENRRSNLRGKTAWKNAKYHLASPSVSPMNTNSGDFEFGEIADVEFPAWTKHAEANEDAEKPDDVDDYLESNARLVMWRVAEKLLAEKAFAPLKLASPFLVGFAIHEQEEVVVRILNWPKPAEVQPEVDSGSAAIKAAGRNPPSRSR